MKNENLVVSIGGYRNDKNIEQYIKDDLVKQGYNIISLFETQSIEESSSLIQNCDILLVLNEDGYTDKTASEQIFCALQNQKIIVFMSDYLLIKSEVMKRLSEENITDIEEFITIGNILDEIIKHSYTFDEIVNKIIIQIKGEVK